MGRLFSDFYREEADFIVPPKEVAKREFGFLSLSDRRMYRHKSFDSPETLHRFLKDTPVLDAYYSGAYYADPEAEMDKKGWEGADLIFDIDADHIPTKCGKIHDEWSCLSCGFAGKGATPEQCPACDGRKFNSRTWPCIQCLEDAKNETVKLLDMLEKDFGILQREIRTFFSGHRGYHVHVESDTVRMLDGSARKEIVDYVIGLGLETSFSNPQSTMKQNPTIPNSPKIRDLGWKGRLARNMYNHLMKADAREYESLGVKKKQMEILLRNRNAILRGWEEAGSLPSVRGIGLETWKRILGACVFDSTAKIDTVVTTDTHRLIRMAGTLHSKTALKKVEFASSKIQDFDPFESAIAFKSGNMTVLVSDAPVFRMSGREYGPYKDRRVDLPTAAALLLVCKGRAEVVC